MSTNHHVPHSYHADLTSFEINRPLGELDSAIETVITTGSGVSTTLTAQAGAGQPSLTVASSAGFAPGDPIYIGTGAMFEGRIVNTVPGGGVTITVTVNLTNTYAIGKPVSKSPVEIVDARDGFTTLGANLEAKIGAIVDRGIGLFGVGATPGKAMPVRFVSVLDGEDIVAADDGVNVLGVYLNTEINGSFAGMGGADPGHLWGLYNFTITGTAADDGADLVSIYGLETEIALQSSGTDLLHVLGQKISVAIWGATAAGSIDLVEGLRIGALGFNDGADDANWTIANLTMFSIDDPGDYATGVNRAMHILGGLSEFMGPVTVNDILTADLLLLSPGSALLSGTGSPNGSLSGAYGAYYFRQDTPGTAMQHLYVNIDGGTTWTALL